MGRFLLGLALGIALAFGYVRWGVSLPGVLELPDRLRGNIVSTAIEGELYDLEQPIATRRRALEVFFANRPQFAAAVDAEFGHPFLKALYRRRAIREARLLRGQWDDFDMALEKPALRSVLVRKHGVEDDLALKQAMLREAYAEKVFLARWVTTYTDQAATADLLSLVKRLAVLPQPSQENARSR